MKYDSIIFDLDGTMWSAVEVLAEVWKGILADLCPEIKITVDTMIGFMGMRMEEVGAKVFGRYPLEKQQEFMRILGDAETRTLSAKGAKPYPHLQETLAELKKTHRLFVVSNCHDGYLQAFLTNHHCWEYFEDFEYDRTGLDKAGNIRLLMDRNGLKSPVYVGDTQGDANSAKKAGIPFIFAAYGFGTVSEYTEKIESIGELCNLQQKQLL